MSKEQLPGRSTNRVSVVDGQYIEKVFQKGPIDPKLRFRRERYGVNHFSGKLAPRFIEVLPSPSDEEPFTLYQELIQGRSVSLIPKDEDTIFGTGQILRQIHTPVKRSSDYLKNDFEKALPKLIKNASKILELIGISDISFDIKWEKVFALGTTRVHRDFRFNNIIKTRTAEGQRYRVIDWEGAGIGSPYEDFGQTYISEFYEHPERQEAFWRGYGFIPDQETLIEYARFAALKRFSTAPLTKYTADAPDRYYHRLAGILKGESLVEA